MNAVPPVALLRLDHVEGGERDTQINRPGSDGAPTDAIAWGPVQREDGVKVRHGVGRSGVRYWLIGQQSWRVMIATATRKSQEIGSARMQDHACGLAEMWEHAVLTGRIDV